MRLAPLICLPVLLAACGDPGSADLEPAPPPAPTFEVAAGRFLERHCTLCHGSREPEAGLDLTVFASDADGLAAHHTVRRMAGHVRHHAMPPRDEPQPDDEERQRFLDWAGRILARADHDLPVDPGHTTLRRLSRVEYRNSIRDLTGVEIDADAELPPDDVGYGFDRIGDVLAMPPLLLEKYVGLAEDVAARAITVENPDDPPVQRIRAQDATHTGKGGVWGDGHWMLYTGGSVAHRFALRRPGEYVVRIGAWAQQAGPELARMRVLADEQVLDQVSVKSTSAAQPGIYEKRVHLGGKSALLRAEFTNDYFAPQAPDRRARDRNLAFTWLEITGPVDRRPGPAPQQLVMFEQPGESDPDTARDRILRRLVTRAYRRPATDDEVASLATLAKSVETAGEPFEGGIRAALTAVLASPQFLFRVERHPHPGDPADVQPLDDHALATRLSYLLWSSTPDDALREAAAAGNVANDLHTHVDRLLLDERADSLVTVFASQWLQLGLLDDASPDPARFPDWDADLRDSMRRETEAFVRSVLLEDRDVRDLLDAPYTYMDGRLARLYGIAGIDGTAPRRVAWPDPARGGLLGQAGVLTMTSLPTRTSVVKRGKYILEALLGAPPPPPPPGVGDLRDDAEAEREASLRERLTRHRADPACAACHDHLDALGFAFEGFDAMGRERTHDGPFPVDSTGSLPDGSAFTGPAGIRRSLREDERFLRHLARQLLVFAIGRGPIPDDERAVDRIVAAAAEDGYRFRAFVHAVVDAVPFRMHRGVAPMEEPR